MRKGFTLIELLIVIAIIAILAAIAIPQFAKYRIRAYNGSAESDLRNARTTEEAFFADWQTYGAVSATLAPNPVAISDGTHTDTFNLSTRVGIVINTDVNYTSYTMMTKHTNGDTYYGGDSDVQGIYYQRSKNYINKDITDASVSCPGSDPQEDDFAEAGGWTLQ